MNSHQLASTWNTKPFLGKEFLTWIWHLSETRSRGGITLPELPTFEIWIDDRLLLQSFQKSSEEHLIRGGDPSRTKEAHVALLEGKAVKELKLGLRIQKVGEFTCTLNSSDLLPRLLTLPQSSTEEPEETSDRTPRTSPVLLRLRQIELFTSVLDHLFAWFLQERTKEDWDDWFSSELKTWALQRA